MLRFAKTLCALLPILASSAALAEPTLYRGEFTLSFLGLSVAKASFYSRVDAGSYSITGGVESAGLGAFFDDTRGSVTASGTFVDGNARPDAFHADYVSGKRKSQVDIAFRDGAVTSTTVIPPPKPRGGDWIPLGPGDLRKAVDPIAGNLIKAGSLDEVCTKKTPLYDGELRADLVFSFVETGAISVKGYEGPTVTCRMRFVPVSGYRTTKKSLAFLRDRSRIVVTFAQLGQTGVYAPVRASIGTEVGSITLKARRFEAMP